MLQLAIKAAGEMLPVLPSPRLEVHCCEEWSVELSLGPRTVETERRQVLRSTAWCAHQPESLGMLKHLKCMHA